MNDDLRYFTDSYINLYTLAKDKLKVKKQIQVLIIKMWCSSMAFAPILFAFCMRNTLSGNRNPWMEAGFVIGITISLGLIYFLPSLFLAIIVARSLVKAETKPIVAKVISVICLLTPIALESSFLYINNLSLIYKGAGVLVLCYLGVLITIPWFYKMDIAVTMSA